VAWLNWTPSALPNVARLHAFLAPKSRVAAKRAVRAIRQGVKELERHPEIGRLVEELPPEFANGSYLSGIARMWADTAISLTQ
jgi:plasmid stabilization system protein ParE